MASRARLYARDLHPGDEGIARLRQFAEELEARAVALDTVEVKAPEVTPSPPAPVKPRGTAEPTG